MNTHHGTNARYVAGCRCDPCRAATRRYHKGLMLDHHRGIRRLVNATGTRRRIEALGALGWTGAQIGTRLGTTGEHIRQLRSNTLVTRGTAARVADIYEQLAMRRPPETNRVERHNASRQRNKAAAAGWLPPLAWVDIDDPTEDPRAAVDDGQPDPVVVDRILGGDYRLTANPAERRQVIARWPGSDNQLEQLTGWNVARDRRTQPEEAA